MPDAGRKLVRVGTRESQLARLQTDTVINRLSAQFASVHFEIVTVKTHGDKILNRPIAELGTRGVFVKELEEALMREQVDLVVHSLKDLPTDLPSGLVLTAVLDRQDPRDVLISHNNLSLSKLPHAARIATSSRRREAQLKHFRQDFLFVDVRGNIPTRLRKHDEGLCDAMVLAAAGLLRLGAQDRIAEYLEPSVSMPAVGQGALAVQCRAADASVQELCQAINEPAVQAEITAERAFLDELGGGCSIPIGALCTTDSSGQLNLSACIAALDAAQVMRSTQSGPRQDAEHLGRDLARTMLSDGASRLVQAWKTQAPHTVPAP